MQKQFNFIKAGVKNIAYKDNFSKTKDKSCSVVFLCGYMSDMEGTKSTYIEDFCTENNLGFLALDYSGHGSSSGDILDGCISEWYQEAIVVIESKISTPVILVGSSMGGWISLLVTLKLKEKVVGILNIASAVDFTEDLMWEEMIREEKAELIDQGVVKVKKGDREYKITKKLIEDGRKNLLMRSKIPIDIPVILLHGMQDDVVPVNLSIKLAEQLQSQEVRVILSKQSDHRMSSEKDLEEIGKCLLSLINV